MSTPVPTSQRLLAAAEELFAAHGLEGVTLRQITARAGANLASVHYHHGGKEEVYREVLARRLHELHEDRMSALTAAEARAAGATIPLVELADILAKPLLLSSRFSPPARRLLGRILVEPHPLHARLLEDGLQPSLMRLGHAFRRHTPTLPPGDFVWTFSLVVGALHHAAASLHTMNERTSGLCADGDGDSALRNFRQLVHRTFAAASQ